MAKLVKNHGRWLVVMPCDLRKYLDDWKGQFVGKTIQYGNQTFCVLRSADHKEVAMALAMGNTTEFGYWLGKQGKGFIYPNIKVIKNDKFDKMQ